MPSINSINFCPNCGSKIIPNANYCLECGYELKLLKEIISKHEKIENSFDNNIEPADNSIRHETEESENWDTKTNDNKISDESENDSIKNEFTFEYVNDKTSEKVSDIQQEAKEDFEIVRPDTEEINQKEYKSDLESLSDEDNETNENNNFNLVRPNSQKVTVKKTKIKKNFSILNQKKF